VTGAGDGFDRIGGRLVKEPARQGHLEVGLASSTSDHVTGQGGGPDRRGEGPTDEADPEDGIKGIVLIYRRNEPRAWALPGGFVDYGESLETAAVREALEETGLQVTDLTQFHTYSAPERDPRRHTISTVFTARAKGKPRPADDAERAGIFTEESLPGPLAFDHEKILQDYFAAKRLSPTGDRSAR